MAAELKLTNTDKVALVDDGRLEWASQWDWQLSSHGYVTRRFRVDGKQTMVFLHREILNAPDGMEVDHINHDTLNNTDENLRLATVSQNRMNMQKPRAYAGQATSSMFKGVTWHKQRGRWMAGIKHNGKRIYLGVFDDEFDAACAYNRKAKELFGEFAKLNELTTLAA